MNPTASLIARLAAAPKENSASELVGRPGLDPGTLGLKVLFTASQVVLGRPTASRFPQLRPILLSCERADVRPRATR